MHLSPQIPPCHQVQLGRSSDEKIIARVATLKYFTSFPLCESSKVQGPLEHLGGKLGFTKKS
jgi:hypothetical protein